MFKFVVVLRFMTELFATNGTKSTKGLLRSIFRAFCVVRGK
jgi:hypothetical protein